MEVLYPRGSEWRKWDLQVQTRVDNQYLCLGNSLSRTQLDRLIAATGLTEVEITQQEKTISADKYAKLFVHYIGLFTDIKVVAITDHNTGKELDYILKESQSNNYGIVILPGVEIASNHGIHMLCVFDPVKKWKDTWAETIDHLLTQLGLSGSHFNDQNQPLDVTKTTQEVLDIVHEKGGVSIFAHIGTSRGLFVVSNTANGGSAHIDIYKHKLCQIVQIPHSGNLNVGTSNIINGGDPNYGNKKVTKIQCSDSRKLSDIGSKFTWIKADPTLNGLRQIIFEPNERARIQEHSPSNDKNKLYFQNFSIEGSTNFIIPNIIVELNRELVTIIGGRGSGKSALLETFAFLNEEHLKADQNGKKKIIEYFRDNEERKDPAPTFIAKTTIIDKNNKPTDYSKSLESKESIGLPFLYLGQEQLSSLSTNDAELTKTVCALIGIGIDEFNPQDLITEARQTLTEIQNTENIKARIVSEYTRYGYDEANDFMLWIKSYIDKLVKQQQQLSSTETQAALKDINTKTQRGLRLRELSASVQSLMGDMRDLTINESLKNLNAKLRELYTTEKKVDLFDPAEKVQKLQELDKELQTEMNELRQAIVAKKTELIGKGIREDVNNLLQASQAVQQQINAANKSAETYKDAQERLTKLFERKDKTLPDIKTMLESLCAEMASKFAEFQTSREDSPDEEKALFLKIIEGIDISGVVSLNQKYLTRALLDRFIDKRKVPNEFILKQRIAGVNTDGSPKQISLDVLAGWIKQDFNNVDYFNVSRKEVLEFLLTQWPEFLKVKAVVRLNSKATDILSIGQRGTLLLKVYLATASARQVLIIDQPEDNLDNSFIMNELVPLIRQAKKSRQIIMSTHNANLVVNADAEEIIVASLDPSSDDGAYVSGSIESAKINSAVRNILEGGEEAFRQREKRYL